MASRLVQRSDSASGAEVLRFDLARFSPKTTRTTQGFLRAPTYFTRAGVLEYTRADGTKVRELRPEEEVFHEDSLATLRGVPLTREHPEEGMVTPENARRLAIGWGSEKVSREDTMAAGVLTIMDAEAIADIGSGKAREVSMGYRCQIDPTSGTHPIHGRYDQIQRTIRYNHAALGGINWGRAGAEVGLRLDASAARCDGSSLGLYVRQQMELKGLEMYDLAKQAGLEEWNLSSILDGWVTPKRAEIEAIAKTLGVEVESLLILTPRVDRADGPGKGKMETIIIGGVEFEVSKATAQAYRQEQTRQDSVVEKLQAENANLKADQEKLQGRFDAQTDELKTTKEELKSANDPTRLDSAIEKRASLVEKVRKVCGEDFDPTGKSARELHETVLRKDNQDLDLSDRSDELVEARFDGFMENYTPKTPTSQNGGLGAARADARQAAQADRVDSREAQKRMRERNLEAWKQPLATTTQKTA